MELKELTIKELLSDYILVIPEIQREYVWGSNQEVLGKFLSELNSSLGEISTEKWQEVKPCFDDKDRAYDMRKKHNSSLQKVNNYYETNIGFLYSYDAGNSEHFIIDGQQRLTTIVLLAYYYAVKDERVSEFNTLLKTATPLMHFSYRVRPLTEKFLQNLFTGVSLDILKNLKESKWYVSDYNNDKTIESICNLYKFICDEKNSFCNLNYDSLLQRVKFYYFDVQQTSQGEELYITMNSRGEQLKDSEQIKPYILDNIKPSDVRLKDAKQWDDWEEYFFEKLKKNEKEINEEKVSKIDIAMDNIIKITLELYGEKIETETDKSRKWEFDEIKAVEDSKRIDFSKIKKVVNNINLLLDSEKGEILKLDFLSFLFSEKRDEKSLFLIESLIRAKELEFDDNNIHRLIRLVNNSLSYGIINHVALLKFLSKMEKTDNIYDFINNHHDLIKDVFINQNNNEELEKIQAILANKVTENDIEEAECIPLFAGKIHLFYRDSLNNSSWESFREKVETARNVFCKRGDKAINEEKYVDFVYNFISAFHTWDQLYDKVFFDNDLSNWKNFLTDLKYLIPFEKALGLVVDKKEWVDVNTKAIWKTFCNKNNITLLCKEQSNNKSNPEGGNPKGRLKWYSNKRLAFYPVGYTTGDGKTIGRDICFDWGEYQRNAILKDAEKNTFIEVALKNKFGTFYCAWNIEFTYSRKKFIWTWDNKIQLLTGDKEVSFTGENYKAFESFMKTTF